MKATRAALVAVAILALGTDALRAQVTDTARAAVRPQARPAGTQVGTPNYDVVLEVPNLSIDSIGLRVADLRAHVALDANAMNLVSIVAGVDVLLQRVELDLVGVVAEVYAYVDLDNVTRIVQRVVRTIGSNPQLLTQLLTTVDTAVSAVGGVANTALRPGGPVTQAVGAVGRTLDNVSAPGGLLSQTVNAAGQTLQRTVDQVGNVVERTLGTTGNVVNQRTVGNLLSLRGLRVLSETRNDAGQTVRRVQDEAGAMIEYTLDAAGRITGTRVLRQAGGR